MDLTIHYKFKARPYQHKVLKALLSGVKRVVWCAHRRSGKDITIFNWVIPELAKTPCTCFYIMPTYSQGKKVIWDALTIDGMRFIDYIPKEIIANKNDQEMKIRLINGSIFQVIGSDNIDSLMGTNPKIVVFSEYALQSPQAWEYIRPILKVNGGVAVFISTPRGRNHFYDLFRLAQGAEGWFAEKLTIEDTKVLKWKDVEQEMIEGMSEETALQEYMCSFDRGIEGSYYSKLLMKMQDENRVLPIPYDPYKLVHTAWDLGWDDCTSILFFQVDGSYINIIDCEEHSTKTLEWYKSLLDSKKYKYGVHLFPHDVETNDGIGSGCTRKEILNDLGISVDTVEKKLVNDGIESVKVLMSSSLKVNSEKCQGLLKAVDHYHRKWDDKRKVYSDKPFHDFSSHYCDALRYMATGMKFIKQSPSTDGDYKALRAYWG